MTQAPRGSQRRIEVACMIACLTATTPSTKRISKENWSFEVVEGFLTAGISCGGSQRRIEVLSLCRALCAPRKRAEDLKGELKLWIGIGSRLRICLRRISKENWSLEQATLNPHEVVGLVRGSQRRIEVFLNHHNIIPIPQYRGSQRRIEVCFYAINPYIANLKRGSQRRIEVCPSPPWEVWW